MELGLGLYARMLTRNNLRFARQIGARAIVVHMADYSPGLVPQDRFDADAKGWDVSAARGRLWELDELVAMRRLVEEEGLRLAAFENLNPALWHDVLLDGPQRDKQLEDLKLIIERIGRAGVGILGYNFTIAGVWGQMRGPWARGGASTLAFSSSEGPKETPLPNGWVWNRCFDPDAPAGTLQPVAKEELWAWYTHFLETVLPVAEEWGVRLAAHPDDPPAESLRGAARSISTLADYERLVREHPGPANALEFCVGTVAEMPEANVYEAVDRYSADGRIGYLHLRNVRGRLPEYTEVFLDEGDVDVLRILRILRRNDYEGVILPDHAPFPECDAPWHAGMAWTLGWLGGALKSLDCESPRDVEAPDAALATP